MFPRRVGFRRKGSRLHVLKRICWLQATPDHGGDVFFFYFILDMQFERGVVSKVMAQVLESYNMSFRDVLKVVVTKMDMADALVKQLGGMDP